jgi:hypothetical protein
MTTTASFAGQNAYFGLNLQDDYLQMIFFMDGKGEFTNCG